MELVTSILEKYNGYSAEDFLKAMIMDEFQGRIGLVSSFGTESAVLLHMVSEIDPNTPVVFLDTGKLFGETNRYRRKLTKRLGLTDVRIITPDENRLNSVDPEGTLWQSDTASCCHIRKVEPMIEAISGFDAWINGRKGHHGGMRANLDVIERDATHYKVTPLARWTHDDLRAYFQRHDLPDHPLLEDGYDSVGCMPCTDRSEGGAFRSGRWASSSKTECGIHLANGGADRLAG